MELEKKRRCFLMCHGEMTGSEQEKFCGFTDPPLSSQGKKSILDLRDRLAKENRKIPNVWYVSDRRRAIQSFEIMTAGVYAPVVRLTEKLREINFGAYENLTWEELPEEFRVQYENYREYPMRLGFPLGEKFIDFCERVSTGALEILSYGEDEIGLIGHQGSLKLWKLMAAGSPISEFFDTEIHYADSFWLDINASDVANWRHRHFGPPGKASEDK